MLSRRDMAAAHLNTPPTVITKVDLTHILAYYSSVKKSERDLGNSAPQWVLTTIQCPVSLSEGSSLLCRSRPRLPLHCM